VAARLAHHDTENIIGKVCFSAANWSLWKVRTCDGRDIIPSSDAIFIGALRLQICNEIIWHWWSCYLTLNKANVCWQVCLMLKVDLTYFYSAFVTDYVSIGSTEYLAGSGFKPRSDFPLSNKYLSQYRSNTLNYAKIYSFHIRSHSTSRVRNQSVNDAEMVSSTGLGAYRSWPSSNIISTETTSLSNLKASLCTCRYLITCLLP
jgi:hypothetical protein